MASIDMINPGIPIDRNASDSTVQSGGNAGGIDMANDALNLSHNPVPSAQKGGASGAIDMVGPTDVLNRGNVQTPYGAQFPSDKGE